MQIFTGSNQIINLTNNNNGLIVTGSNNIIRVRTSRASIQVTGSNITVSICDNYGSVNVIGSNARVEIFKRHNGDSVQLSGSNTILSVGHSSACNILSLRNNDLDEEISVTPRLESDEALPLGGRARRSIVGMDQARGIMSGDLLGNTSSDTSGLVAIGGASAALVLIAVAGVLFARRGKRSHFPAQSLASNLHYPTYDVSADYYMTKEVNFSLPTFPSTPIAMEELKDGMILNSIESEICYQTIPSQCRSNSFKYPGTKPKLSVE